MTDASTIATVVGTAQSLGVDPLTALADALQESGLDPTAVGDKGTSFGLFQLHQGGELGSLTPTQADNPQTNAEVALSEFASVQKSSPGLSPGALAAAAERPASPTAYAADVNTTYQELSANVGQPPPAGSSGLGAWVSKAASTVEHLFKLNPFGSTPEGIATALGTVGGAAASAAANALTTSWGKDALKIGLEIVFVLAGLALLHFGLTRMFPGVTRTVTSSIGPLAMAAAA